MRSLCSLATIIVGLALAPSLASAANQCWQVNSWTLQGPFEVANVTSIPCTNTPLSTGWIPVEAEPTMWLRVPLSDPHIFSPWVFHGTILNDGTSTTPVFQWNPEFDHTIAPWSPDQATPVAGLRGRLRHFNRGRCIMPNATNGGAVTSAPCTNAPAMTYKLIDAGGGKFRLASDPSSKCLYVITPGVSGGTVRNWGCWNDPNMTFDLAAANDGSGAFYLRHQNTSPNQCPYDAGTGLIYHWTCWADPEMRYRFDAL